MPSDHPQTPQSPSQTSPGTNDLSFKPTTSPRLSPSLPTPAHSINGSMSSTGSGFVSDGPHLDEPSNKRKRDADDHGNREHKKVHVDDSRISIEDLHLDVGKKNLLCRTCKTHFSMNLFIFWISAPVHVPISHAEKENLVNMQSNLQLTPLVR